MINMTNRNPLLIIFLFAFVFFSCDKGKVVEPTPMPNFPALTTAGENTCGLKLNGADVIYDVQHFSSGYEVSYQSSNRFLTIRLPLVHRNGSEARLGGMTLQCWVPDTGTYSIDQLSDLNFPFQFELGHEGKTFSSVDSNVVTSGSMTFSKIDLEKKIISGSFDFELLDKTNNEFSTISSGRFDFKFPYKKE